MLNMYSTAIKYWPNVYNYIKRNTYFIVHVNRTSFLLHERCVQSPLENEGSDGSMGIERFWPEQFDWSDKVIASI